MADSEGLRIIRSFNPIGWKTPTMQPVLNQWVSLSGGNPRASDFQSVATPARSATWPPAERQTDPGGSMTWLVNVKPQEGF